MHRIIRGLLNRLAAVGALNGLRRRAARRIVTALGGTTREDTLDLRNRVTDLVRAQNETVAWLCSGHSDGLDRHIASPGEFPLVSIIMSTRNRASVIGRAIESVLAQTWPNWELLIIDDGSTDHTDDVVRGFADDPRIHWLPQPARGVCAARNVGLGECRGDYIAYLDSDNVWFPSFLSQSATALANKPDTKCVYLAQLVCNGSGGFTYVRGRSFDRAWFAQSGGIDLNVFVHRRSLLDEWGGFDEQLTRLVDWDLIARYTRDNDPVFVNVIGCRYEERRDDSISAMEEFDSNALIVRRKMNRSLTDPLRVLYVVADYPQLSESYIRSEIDRMSRWGVRIEVWREQAETGSPFDSPVPLHNGTLEAAIESMRPDVVHVHWLHVAHRYAPVAAAYQLPVTVRGHGFEFTDELLAGLVEDDSVQRVYAFPHMAENGDAAKPKVRCVPVAFNSAWYVPQTSKDSKLVLRCGAGLPTKDLLTFVDIARLCPDHTFVLAIANVLGQEEFYAQLQEHNLQAGGPVEIRFDVQLEDMVELMSRAGIYLHTCNADLSVGMPISIAEAMATGAWVIARRQPALMTFAGVDTAAFYRNADEAAEFIRESADWDEQRWQRVQEASSSRACRNFADVDVLRPLLRHWQQLAGIRVSMTADDPAAKRAA
jgi:glycosyltransferase involved in cell wall biosynthesis